MAAPPPREPAREREVVVTDGGGNPFGWVAGIVALILVVLLAWFLFTQLGGNGEADTDVNAPSVEVPEEVDVNVDNGGGGGGGGGDTGGGGGDTGGGDTGGGGEEGSS